MLKQNESALISLLIKIDFITGFYKTGNNLLNVGYADVCENWMVCSIIKKIQTYTVNICELGLRRHKGEFVYKCYG